jgi:hypothetical protein
MQKKFPKGLKPDIFVVDCESATREFTVVSVSVAWNSR